MFLKDKSHWTSWLHIIVCFVPKLLQLKLKIRNARALEFICLGIVKSQTRPSTRGERLDCRCTNIRNQRSGRGCAL